MKLKIIDRMILLEFIPNFFMAVGILLFVLILNRIFELVNLVIGKGVPFFIVLKLFLYNVPFIVFLAVPMSVLVAVIMTFGRMGSDFEIAALRSCGIDIGRYVAVLMAFASILFVSDFMLADIIVPYSNHQVRVILTQIMRLRPAVNIEEGVISRTYDGEMDFYFGSIGKDGSFENCRIFEKGGGVIISPEGSISGKGEENSIRVHMKNGMITEEKSDYKRINIINFEKLTVTMNLSEKIDEKGDAGRGDREMNTAMLLRNAGKAYENFKNASTKTEIGRKKRSVYKYLTEVHKKFSISFGVFGFMLLGSVMGISLRKSGLGVGFGVSAILFVIYYIMLVVGEQLSDSGTFNPAVTIWFPNFITLLLSGYFLHHALYRMPFRNNRLSDLTARFWRR